DVVEAPIDIVFSLTGRIRNSVAQVLCAAPHIIGAMFAPGLGLAAYIALGAFQVALATAHGVGDVIHALLDLAGDIAGTAANLFANVTTISASFLFILTFVFIFST